MKKTFALVVIAMFAMEFGCNRDSSPIVKAGSSSTVTGVVDLDRVARALGWSDQVSKNVQSAQADVARQVEAHLAPSKAVFEQAKKDLAVQAKLTSDQINALNTKRLTRTDLEHMGFTEKQINDLFGAGNAWQNEVQAAQNIAQQVLGQRNLDIQNTYREAIGPVIRRVANANGRTAIFTPSQIAYFDPSIDLTDKVVEEVQKTPSLKLMLPEMPHVEFPSNSSATAGPTTAPTGPMPMPAAPATGPTTQK